MKKLLGIITAVLLATAILLPTAVSANVGYYVTVPGDGTIGYWKNKGQALLTLEVATYLNNPANYYIINPSGDQYSEYTVNPFAGMFSTTDLTLFKSQVKGALKTLPSGSMADKAKAQLLALILNYRVGFLKGINFGGIPDSIRGWSWWLWEQQVAKAITTGNKATLEQYKDWVEMLNSNQGLYGKFAY